MIVQWNTEMFTLVVLTKLYNFNVKKPFKTVLMSCT